MSAVGFSVDGADEVIHDLTRFRVNLTHAKPALAGMAEVVAAAQRDQFKTQGRHYGTGWDPLSPKYRDWKAKRRPGKKILVFDGNLQAVAAPNRAQDFGVYAINTKSMTVGVDPVDTPTAKWHQGGTANMPARRVIGMPTRQDQKDMVKVLHEHIVKGTTAAGGVR